MKKKQFRLPDDGNLIFLGRFLTRFNLRSKANRRQRNKAKQAT